LPIWYLLRRCRLSSSSHGVTELMRLGLPLRDRALIWHYDTSLRLNLICVPFSLTKKLLLFLVHHSMCLSIKNFPLLNEYFLANLLVPS
jgi:hypothetical protein